MTHETALSRTKEIADRVLAPAAAQNDKAARFATEAVDALGRAGVNVERQRGQDEGPNDLGREVPARSNRAFHHPGGRGFVSRRAAGPSDDVYR